MNYATDVKYLDSHEWARPDGDLFVCGISDYAQDSLSDVVYVELPAVGDTLNKGDQFGVVESVKAASDLYLPIGGEIVEVNESLEEEPEQINADPFGAGWIIKVKPSDPAEYATLLDAAAYQAVAEAEG